MSEDVPSCATLPKELQQVRDECVAFLAKEANGDENWEQLRNAATPTDLSVWQFTGENKTWGNDKIICVRGSLRFPDTAPDEILNMILKLEQRPQWDDAMKEGAVKLRFENVTSGIEGEDKSSVCGSDIAHLVYKGVPFLVSGRDLCLFRYWQSEKDSSSSGLKRSMLVAKSVKSEAVPETTGNVRADLMECGYLMQEGEDSDGKRFTNCTYISSLDFKGDIPPQMVNLILMQQPGSLQNMRRLLGKGGASTGGCSVM